MYWVLGRFQDYYQEAVECPRSIRRAAAYSATAELHLKDPVRLKRSENRILTIEPDFDPEAFSAGANYQGPAMTNRLPSELKQALQQFHQMLSA